MFKLSRIGALTLSFGFILGLGAFASGEASMSMNTSEEPGVVAFYVDADGLTETTDDGVLVFGGEVTDEYADGILMEITDHAVSGFTVSGGEYAIRNSVITKSPSAPAEESDGVGHIACVSDGLLTIDNCTFVSNGKGGMSGNYTVRCMSSGTMVVSRSRIVNTGSAGDPYGYTAEIGEPKSNAALLVSGYARANMSMGGTSTYYYGSVVETEGWAAMSTDSASSGFVFYSYDSSAYALHGGYGTYADSNCVNWFYASHLQSAETGGILMNNAEIHMNNGSAADEAALAYLPADYELSDRYGDGRCTVAAGRNDFMIHSPDMFGTGAGTDWASILDLEDTDFYTSEELDAEANLIDWQTYYGPAIGEYIDYIKGANILVKSTTADIDLKNVTAESYSGVLLMTALNSDSMSKYGKATDDMAGRFVTMTITDSDLSGDVVHADYQRSTAVELVGSTWSGAYVTLDKAAWDALWSDTAKADENCGWILDETYNDGSDSVSTMSVDAASVWNVIGESSLDELTVEAGGTVNGIVTVDGQPVDVSAGGHWAGDILVSPAA